MAVLPGTATSQQLLGNCIAALIELRSDLEKCADLQGWISAHSQADLVAMGLDSGTATALMSAMADAAALSQIYNTGLPPGSYPQPASAYVYGTSQRAIIGPQ